MTAYPLDKLTLTRLRDGEALELVPVAGATWAVSMEPRVDAEANRLLGYQVELSLYGTALIDWPTAMEEAGPMVKAVAALVAGERLRVDGALYTVWMGLSSVEGEADVSMDLTIDSDDDGVRMTVFRGVAGFEEGEPLWRAAI